MPSISPNYRVKSSDSHASDWTRLLTRCIRTSAVVAALVGMNQSGWSESEPAHADSDSGNASAQTNPTVVPPLTIGNYENYIKTRLPVPRVEARPARLPASASNVTEVPAPSIPKRLEPITIADRSNKSDGSTDESALRVITFAAVAEPAQVRTLATTDARANSRRITTDAPSQNFEKPVLDAEPRPESNAALQETSPATNELRVVSKSVVVSPPASDSITVIGKAQSQQASEIKTELFATPPLARRVAMVDQTAEAPKPRPTPAEAKVEGAPVHTESIPLADPDGPPTPMTNSSYLPANSEGYCFRCGVKCPPCGCNPGGPGWSASRPIPWEVFAQGEYVGPARLAHVPVYRIRVDDRLAFVYRLSGQISGQPYRLNVRDRVLVQSVSAPEVVNREVIVEPDGTITLPLLGQVRASGATLEELSRQLDNQFKSQIKDPRITVIPLVMNSNLEELRSSVDRRYGQGGQVSDARVSPDGTIQLPAIGPVPAQGLTLDELEREVKARYGLLVSGLEVTPILTERAPRFIYVVGEVHLPGRYSMEGPTTLMQAIALAGSWNIGAQLNEVVVFRRDENWHLMATKVNIRNSLLFKKPCSTGEIWLRDSDIVLVPKSPILCADDAISLLFTRGIYGVFPMSASLNFAKLSSL